MIFFSIKSGAIVDHIEAFVNSRVPGNPEKKEGNHDSGK